jgi:hypothetical protein
VQNTPSVCVRRAGWKTEMPPFDLLIYLFLFTAIGELQSELFDAKARSEEIAHAK